MKEHITIHCTGNTAHVSIFIIQPTTGLCFLQLDFFGVDFVLPVEGTPLLFVGLLLPVEGMLLLVEGLPLPVEGSPKGPTLSLSTEKLSCDRVCCGLGGGEGGHTLSPSITQVGEGDSTACPLTIGEEFRRTTLLIEGVVSFPPRLMSSFSPSPSLVPLSVLTES